MNRTAALLAITCAAVAVAAPSALAAPPKKFSKTYTTTTPMPDPTNFNPQAKYSVCEQTVPGSFNTEPVKIPGKGMLHVELTGYVGDYDLLLMDVDKEELANSGQTAVQGEPEIVDVSFKKPTTVYIVNCNWAGAPTSKVSYTFTPKK
jgi:hypothetical protein